MFDATFENPAALIGLMAALALTLVWSSAELARAARGPRASTALGHYGVILFAGVWLLVPLSLLTDLGFVGLLANLQWLACALLCAAIAGKRSGPLRWLFAAGAAASLLTFAAPPPASDLLNRTAGWALIVGALSLRYLRSAQRWPLGRELGQWINRTRLGLPLALTAGTLLQHPAFQALSEAALSAAAVHALAFVLLRTGARPAPAWEAILPFADRPAEAGVNDFRRGAA